LITKEISPISSNDGVKEDAHKRRSELNTFVKDSELYLSSVIDKMNDDLSPHMSQHAKLPLPKTGKIRKNKAHKGTRSISDLKTNEHNSFIAKHSRALSLKPELIDNDKENVNSNIGTKDVWYNVNRCLERNGYSKISITNKTDPGHVCNTVLEILHDYEQRGQKIQEFLTEKRALQNPYQITAYKNQIAKLEENNEKYKQKIKGLEYDLNKDKSKRKEWSSSTKKYIQVQN